MRDFPSDPRTVVYSFLSARFASPHDARSPHCAGGPNYERDGVAAKQGRPRSSLEACAAAPSFALPAAEAMHCRHEVRPPRLSGCPSSGTTVEAPMRIHRFAVRDWHHRQRWIAPPH
ncbi:unnamed protein product [Ixodes persulcatus]